MKLQFDIAEQEWTVHVTRQPRGYEVIVGGRTFFVDVMHVESQTWSLLLRDPDGLGGTSIEAVVVPQPEPGVVDVHIDGHRIPVGMRGGLGRRSRGESASQGVGPQRLKAPMPGKVVRVLIKTGDAVQARQGLVVVEAMKMENELRAARAGRVRDVLVEEGQSVEAGADLVIVE